MERPRDERARRIPVITISMQPTVVPYSSWYGWYTRHRLERQLQLSLHDLHNVKIDWSVFGHRTATAEIPHLLSRQALGRPGQRLVFPTVSSSWLRNLPRDPALLWRLPDLPATPGWQPPREPLPPIGGLDTMWSRGPAAGPPGSAGGAGPPGGGAASGAGGWERGLPLGAVVLVLLMVLMRLADKCLDNTRFKTLARRRASEEWFTPNVLATSHRYTIETETSRPAAEAQWSPAPPPAPAHDAPPPYSRCAGPGARPALQEPPPPYSASYAPRKPGAEPTVHLCTARVSPDTDTDTDTTGRQARSVGALGPLEEMATQDGLSARSAGHSEPAPEPAPRAGPAPEPLSAAPAEPGAAEPERPPPEPRGGVFLV